MLACKNIPNQMRFQNGIISRSISTTNTQRQSTTQPMATQAQQSTYRPKRPVIRPRENLKVMRERIWNENISEWRKHFKVIAREYEKKQYEDIMRSRGEIELRRRIKLEKRMIESADRDQRELADLKAKWLEEKDRLRAYRDAKRQALVDTYKLGRHEFINALEDSMPYWVVTPDELGFNRYYIHEDFQLRGSKLERWMSKNLSPFYNAAQNRRAHGLGPAE